MRLRSERKFNCGGMNPSSKKKSGRMLPRKLRKNSSENETLLGRAAVVGPEEEVVDEVSVVEVEALERESVAEVKEEELVRRRSPRKRQSRKMEKRVKTPRLRRSLPHRILPCRCQFRTRPLSRELGALERLPLPRHLLLRRLQLLQLNR
jgi:hypothetical protein